MYAMLLIGNLGMLVLCIHQSLQHQSPNMWIGITAGAFGAGYVTSAWITSVQWRKCLDGIQAARDEIIRNQVVREFSEFEQVLKSARDD